MISCQVCCKFKRMPSMYICSVLLSLCTIHFLTSCSTPVVWKPPKLALRLIHRDSVLSPRYNSKVDEDVRAPLLPLGDGSIFLVNISVGVPAVPQLLAMDTGSQLTWIKCKDCYGCKNVYNPKTSTTFSALTRDSPQCIRSKFGPQAQKECTFSFSYQDLSSSSGILAVEKFTFLTSTGGTTELPDLAFGCARKSSGTVVAIDGILALEAPDRYCLPARTGTKFSYCLGNINDPEYMFNQLILGDGAVLQGDSTPMQIKDTHYVVTLEGISVGGKQITINPREFHYNVVIDSGSTYMELKRSAYQPLIAEVRALVDRVLTRVVIRNAEDQICYKGDIDRDLEGFPVVTLHLAQGTDIDLDVDALFQRSKDGSAFCVAVVESRENIIGVKAQQYYNVGFDLDAMRISFQRIDCELLEE